MDIYEAYKTWPEDIRKKLSIHDLRRMTGWAPKGDLADWRIDTSTPSPILTYKGCSVIQDEEAHYVIGLIRKDSHSRMQPADVYPVPDDEDQPGSGLQPGPEMPSNVKPVRDGRYLRFFYDQDDWAWSWFMDGKWTYDGFFASDIQDAPWRGAVRPNTRVNASREAASR